MTTRRSSVEVSRRRRAALRLATIPVAVVLVGGLGLGMLSAGRYATSPHQAPVTRRPPASVVPEPGWDVAAENALSQRVMLQLPVQDAQPQPLAATPPAGVITVAAAAQTNGQWIPTGFPLSPEGAVGQLQALTGQALIGVDPIVVDRAYRMVSEPGAPDPSTSMPYRTVLSLRAAANLPSSGPVPGLTANYQPTEGLIKGSTDGGRFVVACVLGVLSADYQDRFGQAGFGICEAMRWRAGQWRIAPVARAAAGTSAWPGSDPAIRAGYREIRDDS